MPAIRSLLAVTLLALAVHAQSLGFEVRGGSIGAPLTWEVSGGTPFFQAGFILPSINTGPTPLGLLDPRDTRSLDVGTESLDLAFGGPFLANARFVAPTITIPSQPSLIDSTIFLQAISIPGTTFLIDGISPVRALRFGPATTFHDRFVPMTSPRSFFPVVPRADGTFVLLGGGQGALFAQVATDQTDIYDPVSDSFTTGPMLTSHRSLHTGTQLLDGRWLLVGGVDQNNDPQTTAEIYDPVANTCTAVPSMGTPRMEHAAVRLPDGRVFVSGGITDLNAPNSQLDPIYSTTTSTEIYDPTSNTWTPGPAMLRPRVGHQAILRTDGKVQLIGGLSYTTFIISIPTIERTTDIYDPVTGQVTAGAQLQTPRAGPAVAALPNHRWLLAGGVSNISLTQLGTPTATAEIFDAATGQFTSTGSMAQARVFPAVLDLGGGQILLAGGGQGALFAATSLASSEVWDATAGTWTAGPTMNFPRLAEGAFETPTGQFVLMGGESTAGVTNSTEFFYR